MGVLSPEQKAQFEEQGYLLVSGLVPSEVVAEAKERLERLLQEPDSQVFFGTDAANACYTESLCAAAAELGGEAEIRPYYPIEQALAIIIKPGEKEWNWPPPHIDHAIEKAGYHVFPRPFRVASLLYLSDGVPHGGNTVVWPGSHRQIERLAKSDPERYQLMHTVNQNLDKAGLGDPVELTPRAGDILFYHYLCAHSGSENTTEQPRLALNHKW
jgi:hypothetical protein